MSPRLLIPDPPPHPLLPTKSTSSRIAKRVDKAIKKLLEMKSSFSAHKDFIQFSSQNGVSTMYFTHPKPVKPPEVILLNSTWKCSCVLLARRPSKKSNPTATPNTGDLDKDLSESVLQIVLFVLQVQ